MSQWFYAEGNRERRGPLPAENIVSLFRSGRIAADTLVWREGAAEWQPLQAVAAELGLDELANPAPPLAPTAPHIPDPPGPSPQFPAPPPPPAPPATKPGLSGCAIAGIVLGIGGVALIVIVGILAAIAIPQYHEYTLRSRTAMAKGQLVTLKPEVAAFATEHDRCPVNGDEGFGSPESYADRGIASVRIGRYDNGHCGLEARLSAPGTAQLDGKLIWLDYDTQTATWECSSDVADTYLPTDCRR